MAITNTTDIDIRSAVLSRSVVFDSVTPWTVAHQAPLSMGIFQARILEGVAIPSFRGLPDPGIPPRSPALQADSLPSKPPDTGFTIFYNLFVY